MLNLIRKAIKARCAPYRVYVQFGDFDGTSHKSWTLTEAIEWMACYPNECQVFVFSRVGLTKRFYKYNNVVAFRQGTL